MRTELNPVDPHVFSCTQPRAGCGIIRVGVTNPPIGNREKDEPTGRSTTPLVNNIVYKNKLHGIYAANSRPREPLRRTGRGMATEQDSFAALCQTGGLPWWVTGCKCLGGLVQATFPPCQCKRRNEKDRYGERLRTAQEALMSVIVKVYTIWQSTESGIPPSNCFPSYLRHVPRPWIFVPSRSASSTKCATGATSRPKIRTRKASARQPPTLRAPSLRPRRSAGAGVSRKRCRAPGLKRRNKREARRPQARTAAPRKPCERTRRKARQLTLSLPQRNWP